MPAGGQTAPRLRPDVRLSDALWRGAEQVHYVRGGAGGAILFASRQDVALMRQMDGRINIADIAEQARDVDGDYVRGLLERMRDADLLATSAPTLHARQPDRAVNDGVLVRGDGRLMRWIAGTPVSVRAALLWVNATLGVVGLMATVALLWPLAQSGREVMQAPLVLVLVALAVWASFVPHELAHAATAIHVRAQIAGFGLMWRPPIVVPYCVVRDGMFVHGGVRRASVAAAGPLANVAVTVPLVILWSLLPDGAIRGAVAVSVIGIVLSTLAALVPARGFDGLSVMNHLSASVDLERDSRIYHRARREGAVPDIPTGRRRWFWAYVILYIGLVLAATGLASVAGWVFVGSRWGAVIGATIGILGLTAAIWPRNAGHDPRRRNT